MLEAKQLTKRYGEKLALDSLDLQIAPGEIYCLVGANGAGKTTTISLFLDFISPTSGSALVNDICIAEQPSLAKRHLAYIPETVCFTVSSRAWRTWTTFLRWPDIVFRKTKS